MSRQITSSYFGLHLAKQFQESINETANSVYYVFAGKSTPYGNTDAVVSPNNTVQTVDYDVYDDMLFGKRVGPNDVAIMIPRYEWQSGQSYDAYRDTLDLTTKRYFVCVNAVSQYHVFKVLDNNRNGTSTVAPAFEETSPTDEFYQTSDGYVWKYMYTIPKATFDKFATSTSIPVVENANVIAAASNGAIDFIDIAYGGSQYNGYVANTFNINDIKVNGGNTVLYAIANNAVASNGYYTNSAIYIASGTGAGQLRRIYDYFLTGNTKIIQLESAFTVTPDNTSQYEITPYVKITGDGSGAIARAIANTNAANTISRVEIISRGSGYSWATAVVQGARDGSTDNAVLRPVKSPKGGHGSNPAAELQGTMIGIGVSFANNEGNTIPITNDFRTVGLLKDPVFASVSIDYVYSNGTFSTGQVVVQEGTNATGTIDDTSAGSIELVNVTGVFVTGYQLKVANTANAFASAIRVSGFSKGFDTFDQRTKYTYVMNGGGSENDFIEDETLYAVDPSISNGVFHSADSNYIYVTGIRGTLAAGDQLIGQLSVASANALSVVNPDIVKGSGEIIYIENVNPISRSETQTESIKIVLKF